MKIAIFSESPADEAAIKILAEAVIGRPVELAAVPLRQRAGGWPSVRDTLPAVISSLHYHSEAEALIVVADSDRTPLHGTDLAQACGHADCRLCQLVQAATRATAALRPVAGKAVFRVAIGLASPAVEAWYLADQDHRVGEAAWRAAVEAGKFPYNTNALKAAAYGTDRPSLEIERRAAIEHAHRVARRLDELERKFPVGFGSFARAVRSWR